MSNFCTVYTLYIHGYGSLGRGIAVSRSKPGLEYNIKTILVYNISDMDLSSS